MHDRTSSRMTNKPSNSCYAGTGHVGFSETRQALLAPSVKPNVTCRATDVHEGRAASCQQPLYEAEFRANAMTASNESSAGRCGGVNMASIKKTMDSCCNREIAAA